MIPLAEVTSSSILAVGWAPKKGMLVVFHGSPDKLYCYPCVSEHRTRELLSKPSIGKAFVTFRAEPYVTQDWDGILQPKTTITDWYSVWLQTMHA
ncbi:KTSC domain-containing protein [Gulbenkiania mobilis]|uniref:KTSC domain-containing protein n=1 Tax=Gulbenkiania mobilis TaxID=397457 RepID=UPI0006BBF933|nr:KTSC domain-containing protein [Gulbenkiania mobilis]